MDQEETGIPQVSMRPMGAWAVPAAGAAAPRPGGALFWPAGAPAPMPQVRTQLTQVLRALESAMPAEEVMHSLHAEALKDPAVTHLPAMQRFTETSVAHLHTMVAAAGYIRRVLSGDRSPAVMAGLQEQLQALHPTHAEAKSAFTQMMASAETRANPAVQALSQVLQVVDQAHKAVMAVVQPMITVAAH